VINVVIDTNLYVSALINQNSRQRLQIILKDHRFNILVDETLIRELHEVIHRPKFAKYVSKEQINAFFDLLNERSKFINTASKVLFSPDPKDDFLLALCLDGNAEYLITGNKIDLLDLKQFEQTKIYSLTNFLALHFPGLT
jgi:putative PIN family toxin of toxin-antitoxin system